MQLHHSMSFQSFFAPLWTAVAPMHLSLLSGCQSWAYHMQTKAASVTVAVSWGAISLLTRVMLLRIPRYLLSSASSCKRTPGFGVYDTSNVPPAGHSLKLPLPIIVVNLKKLSKNHWTSNPVSNANLIVAGKCWRTLSSMSYHYAFRVQEDQTLPYIFVSLCFRLRCLLL